MACRICEGCYGDNGQPQTIPGELPGTVLVTDVTRDPGWVRDVWELPDTPTIVPSIGVGTWSRPTAEHAYECGRHRLVPALKGCRAVAAGHTATAALLGPGRHAKARWEGSVMPVPDLPGPDTTRRDRLVAAYMARAGLYPGKLDTKYCGEITGSDTRLLLAEIRQATGLSWDLETSGLDPRADGASILCASVTTWKGDEVHGTWVVTGEAIPEFLGSSYWPEIVAAHNGKYDQLWAYQIYGIVPPVTWDTMLAEHLIDSEGPRGLKILGAKYLHIPDWSSDLKDPMSVPHAELLEYAAMDAAATAEVHLRQRPHRRLLTDLLMPASQALLEAEVEGVGLDLEGAIELRDNFRQQDADITEQVSTYGPAETPRQVAELLYETLRLPVLERTPTGRPRVTGSILRRLGHPVADALADRAKIRKGVSAFLNPWINAVDAVDPRLYSTFRLAGTATGRLSSGGAEGAAGINLQQIPRDSRYKRLIQARPGYILAELDYSQIELRVAASLSGDPCMIGIYHEGGDIHATTAKAVTGKQFLSKSDRTKAKAVNFGFLYGMGASSFRDYARDNYGVRLSEEEAVEYRKRFFEFYSELPKWHAHVKEEALRNGYVRTLFGRVRYLDGIRYWSGSRREAALRQAVNTSVQSVASDMMILALGMIHRLIVASPKYEAEIIATVHDSVLLEIKEEGAEKTARKAKYIMEHLPLRHFGVELDVPIEAGLSMGHRWGEMGEF